MAERMYSEPRRNREEEEITAESSDAPQSEATDTDINGVLDEIDEVLEKNAEEFVNNYIQKGGQ